MTATTTRRRPSKSDLIDELLGPDPGVLAPTRPCMRNRLRGWCHSCGRQLAAREGRLGAIAQGGPYRQFCPDHESDALHG